MDVATYRDHLASVKREIHEISPKDAAERLASEPRPALLDVRERDEWEQGHIPGAIHIPRGNLESRIDNAVSDRATPLIIDGDVVDRSNLQRQILHGEDRIGMAKVDSAEQTLKALNPEVKVVKYTERMTSENVMDVISGYDVIVDGTDNFPTRYLLNDASL